MLSTIDNILKTDCFCQADNRAVTIDCSIEVRYLDNFILCIKFVMPVSVFV